MTQEFKLCPECGADQFKIQDYDKKSRELDELSSRFKRALANHGLVRAEWDLKEIELTEGMKWLQRKTKKQAQAITGLENKLKKFGGQPYKEDDPSVVVPTVNIIDQDGRLLMSQPCGVTLLHGDSMEIVSTLKIGDGDDIRRTD